MSERIPAGRHPEIQQILRAVVEGQRVLTDEVRRLSEEIRGLDALIKGRRDGEPPRLLPA